MNSAVILAILTSGSLQVRSGNTNDGSGGVTVNSLGISTSLTGSSGFKVDTNPVVECELVSILVANFANGGGSTNSAVSTTSLAGLGGGGLVKEVSSGASRRNILSGTGGSRGSAGNASSTN